ncbi:hypothetical protein JOC34_000645 [Virgibacillus halotolerans]|uniref:hypothetical protein n=1 Tax=Virgibacillus halotolerans TaxID=1071053 RepID=UPI001960F13F|nr:hypothetical protein [Virgibacillus halotolerans]MBM7598288.1 hypothetical protein [Virgibacillus halotolerans]
MSNVESSIYPNKFIDFSEGYEVSNDRVNETINRIISDMTVDEKVNTMTVSTGNTKVNVTRDRDMDTLIVEVYKNYQRKTIRLDELKEEEG